jgi:hypothetical protein
MTHPQPDKHFCLCHKFLGSKTPAVVLTMVDSNSDKAVNVSDSIDIESTHQGRSNDTMEVEDEAELMMIDSTMVSLLYHL